MSTIVKLYASYGVLAHEKRPVFTTDYPATNAYDEIMVEIPYPVWRSTMNELGVTINGQDYLLSEVLTNRDFDPVLRWCDGQRIQTRLLKKV